MSPRESLSSWRARQNAAETSVVAAVAEVKAERDAEWAEARQAAQQAAAERKTYTRDDLLGADVVRTKLGWYKVVRLNQQSVTVDSGHSWTSVVPFAKILDARSIGGDA
ncbi:hypothetical protein [Leifsonia sp. P73]|uniref:hypothetical protein n=1 Tax=Leifsonia sp. P73 TaxID=3423959 RepID=UPI003DA41F0F